MRLSAIHKYKVGQKVRFFPAMSPVLARGDDSVAARERYEVTRLLPNDGAEFQYRIKGCEGGIERVVRESEIS
jgi:hypothetical protein